MSEPLSIGIYAVKQSIPLKGTRIGIPGSGPVGMSVMLAAAVQQPAGIYMTDKIDERLLLVKAMIQLEPDGFDVAFECSGKQEALNQAFEILKPG